MYVKVDVYFTVSNRPKAFRLAALAYDLPWLQTMHYFYVSKFTLIPCSRLVTDIAQKNHIPDIFLNLKYFTMFHRVSRIVYELLVLVESGKYYFTLLINW